MKQTIVLCPEFSTEHRQSPTIVVPHRLRAYLDLRLLPRPVGLLPFDALCPLSFSDAVSVYVQGGVVWYLVQPRTWRLLSEVRGFLLGILGRFGVVIHTLDLSILDFPRSG